jgi:hypothetical protein
MELSGGKGMISFYVRTSFRISDLNNVARERERVATHECGETGGYGEDGRGEQKKETGRFRHVRRRDIEKQGDRFICLNPTFNVGTQPLQAFV